MGLQKVAWIWWNAFITFSNCGSSCCGYWFWRRHRWFFICSGCNFSIHCMYCADHLFFSFKIFYSSGQLAIKLISLSFFKKEELIVVMLAITISSWCLGVVWYMVWACVCSWYVYQYTPQCACVLHQTDMYLL